MSAGPVRTTFTAFAGRTNSKGKAYIDFNDIDLAETDPDEDDAVIALGSHVNYGVHDTILVLNSSTYEIEEHPL